MRFLDTIISKLRPSAKAPTAGTFTSARDAAEALVPALLSAAEAGTGKPQAYGALYDVLSSFEQTFLHRDHYAAAHYMWADVLTPAQRDTLLASLSDVEAASLPVAELIRYLAVIWRLHGDGAAAHRALLSHISNGGEPNLSAGLQFELCQIFWIFNDWEALRSCAMKTAVLEDLPTGYRHYCCDFAVLAIYRKLQPLILQGKPVGSLVDDLKVAMAFGTTLMGSESRNAYVYRGIEACLEGDYPRAIEQFIAANDHPGPLHTAFRTIEGIMPLSDLRSLDVARVPSWGETSCKPVWRHTDQHFAHLLSCDKTYYDNFFDRFAAAYGALNPGGLLHLHCVNFSLDETALIALEEKHHIAVNITVDHQGDLEGNVDLYRGYAACARYMFLPQYLEAYRYVAVTDIDGVPALTAAEIRKATEGKILIKSKLTEERSYRPVLWSAIWAGTFAIEALAENKVFAATLSAYLRHRFAESRRTGEKFFFADQVGLMLCYLAFRDTCSFDQVPALYRQQQFDHFGVIKNRAVGQGKA